MHRFYNFSAGPGTLPLEVIQSIRADFPVFNDTGASVMEISHRSPAYTEIQASARATLRRLLGLGDEWHILFLQGGASMQFHQVPLNFLPAGGTADYLVTGTWAKKAYQEACRLGKAQLAGSSEDRAFSYLPSSLNLDPKAAYLHFTSNNTVYGTQFPSTPEATVPLVCDASSDFLSRPIELDRYGLIYAGAQKNIGPAGVTVVLIREDFLQCRNRSLPTMLDYGTHAAKLFNTPPVFAVYAVDKVLQWLEGLGGISAIEKVNSRKASLIYDAIDATSFYRGTVEPQARSLMNVTFRLPSEELEARFLTEAATRGMVALKGHRSVGGVRASIYNACPMGAVEALVDFMQSFERSHG